MLHGVSVADEGEGNGNNTRGSFTLKFSAEPNKISDVIKYITFTS
jgi:hypothetical protein